MSGLDTRQQQDDELHRLRMRVAELEQRLSDRTSDAERLSAALNGINQLIHSSLDSPAVLRRVVSAAAEAFRCESAAISVKRESRWFVEYAHGFAGNVVGAEMTEAEEPHATLAIQTGQPVAIDDAFNDERVNRDHMRRWGVRSVLVVPLIAANEPMGVLFLNHTASATAFSAAEIDAASKLASSLSLALTNARLVEDQRLELAQRRRTEAALRASEERLRRVLETDAVAVIFFDQSGTLVNANDVFLRITGRTRSEIHQRQLTWRSMTPPEWVAASERQIEALRKTGRIGPYEKEYFLANGERRWMLFAGRDLGDGTVVEYGIDIDDRKRAEAAAAENRARLDAALASMTDAVFIADTEGRFIHTNAAFAHYHRFGNPEECCKAIDNCPDVLEAFLPDGSAAPLEMWAVPRALRGETATNFHYTLRRKDTGESWVGSYSFGPVRDQAGAITGAVVVARDVTESKRAEEALRRSEERFRRLYDSNIIGIASADLDRVYEGNDVFLEMLGCTRRDLDAGRIRWREFTPPEYVHLDERAVEELLSAGSCQVFEKEIVRKDGSRVPILIGATRVQAEPLKWLCFLVDLTERKQLEKRLLDKQKLESIGILAGGIAHDFNNLLVGILGNASLAQDMLPPENSAGPVLDAVVKAGERAADLIRQMLAYSGKGQFVVGPVNLSKLVEQMTRLLHTSIPGNVSIRFELDPDILPVQADVGQMQQVVMNVVLNAAEAIGSEPGVITIRTGVRTLDRRYIRQKLNAEIEPGTYVWLEVRDTGCGMNDATMARMFDPFFTTKFTGRGLGLAAASGIVRGHKGAVRVSSAPGKGTTFLVLFPSSAEKPTQPEVAPPDTDAGAQCAGTILVIDDEEVVRGAAKKALERQGYTVVLAESGPLGIDALRREKDRVTAVILDLSMPGMNGQETLKHLRAIRPKVPVIVSSGYSETETMRLFTGQHVGAFIQKPYTAARLAGKVKAVIEGTARVD